MECQTASRSVSIPSGLEPGAWRLAPERSDMHIDDLLRMLVAREASDLHIRAGEPPVMRIHGELTRTDLPMLTGEDTHRLLFEIMNEERRQRYEQTMEMDMSHAIPGLARFRVNVFRQRGQVG